jgi:hypothetical protein
MCLDKLCHSCLHRLRLAYSRSNERALPRRQGAGRDVDRESGWFPMADYAVFKLASILHLN